jgi:hypothetical protein
VVPRIYFYFLLAIEPLLRKEGGEGKEVKKRKSDIITIIYVILYTGVFLSFYYFLNF